MLESESSNHELAQKLEESAKNALQAEQQLIGALEIFKYQLAYQVGECKNERKNYTN